MKEATIEELAYLIKETKNRKTMPKPIVFLGAGASKTDGIPLAREIVEDIKKYYKDSPKVKKLDSKSSYTEFMDCLQPFERKDLLSDLFLGWGNALASQAILKNDESLMKQSFEKYEKATQLNPKDNAIKYLAQSLEKKDVSLEHVEGDSDWDGFKDDSDFIELLDKHRSS
ncbi:MAG: hypothetical protein ABUK01_10645 [Leptospirales bacterium]